ncbi:uncharacterized protein LOC141639204 [Silene latifolia]|uniref:uncharacterized protein LOC141639204 n=1 Tax=Silene latifolia TaxID=37657 RepID=UPI003D7810F7
MRIRKRKVPLPLSLLSPIPITDAHLFSRSSVSLVQPTQDQTTHTSNVNSQPSDHLTTFDLRRSIDDGNSSNDQHHDCLGFKGVESVPKSNDAGNKSITALGAAAVACCINAPLPLSHHQEKMRWCDEDKAMPLKKRRGSLDSTETTNVVDATSKSLENNVEKPGVDEEEVKGNYDESNSNGVNGKKGSKRGKTIMEGSRCSRVNGRGWRCCQPTLVGYSLCEHHLGKGRLRNMSSVRGRTTSMPKNTALGTSSETLGNSEKMKKRAKIGVVKARSLSSLLGQTVDTSSSNDSSRIAAALEYAKEII